MPAFSETAMCDNCENVKHDPRHEDEPRPKRVYAQDGPMNTAACRTSAAHMLQSEATSLRHQADQLDALAKLAAFAEGTPAEEALWALVIRGRNR